jgi:hypothetical protein
VRGEDCWWTGCQPDAWAVKGCDQYGRMELGREGCPGGNKYNCCAGGPGRDTDVTFGGGDGDVQEGATGEEGIEANRSLDIKYCQKHCILQEKHKL